MSANELHTAEAVLQSVHASVLSTASGFDEIYCAICVLCWAARYKRSPVNFWCECKTTHDLEFLMWQWFITGDVIVFDWRFRDFFRFLQINCRLLREHLGTWMQNTSVLYEWPVALFTACTGKHLLSCGCVLGWAVQKPTGPYFNIKYSMLCSVHAAEI